MTRGKGLNHADCTFFENLGYQTLVAPLSVIKLLPLSVEAINELEKSQWVFFTSQAPVKSILSAAPKDIKIAAIGKKTASEVKKYGYNTDFVSPIETKMAMLTSWKKLYPERTSIFYPKSQLADKFLENFLKTDNVYSYVAYENDFTQEDQNFLKKLLMEHSISAVYLTSPSAWQRFYRVNSDFEDLEFIVIGETTKEAILADFPKACINLKNNI